MENFKIVNYNTKEVIAESVDYGTAIFQYIDIIYDGVVYSIRNMEYDMDNNRTILYVVPK